LTTKENLREETGDLINLLRRPEIIETGVILPHLFGTQRIREKKDQIKENGV